MEERKAEKLLNRLEKSSGEVNALVEKLEESNKRVEELENQLKEQIAKVDEMQKYHNARKLFAVVDINSEFAFYEGIYDILVCKKIVTQAELQHYFDLYKQAWSVIVNILIDKGITNEREINCATLTYHHIILSQGANTGKSLQEIFEERQKYFKMLMAMPDPLSMIGR